MLACDSILWPFFQTSVFSISDTAADTDFEIVNSTVFLRNNTGCFRIDIINDSDPEPAENFTISFVVNGTQPEGVKLHSNQSEAVITIQENDSKSYWCHQSRRDQFVWQNSRKSFSGLTLHAPSLFSFSIDRLQVEI